MRWIRLDLEYDGTKFLGWQKQPQGRVVQGVLEEVLSLLFQKETRVQGAGRTDAGVHAMAQCARFHTVSCIPLKGLVHRLNELLPEDVSVWRAWEVDEDFHPRYSVQRKTYVYLLRGHVFRSPLWDRYAWRPCVRHLDLDSMVDACCFLQGEHDFRSFSCERDPGQRTLRRLDRCAIQEIFPGTWKVVLQGPGFLNRMARMIVGTLVEVGRGKKTVAEVERFLEEPVGGSAGPAAPARGLYLSEIAYPSPWNEEGDRPRWPERFSGPGVFPIASFMGPC